MQSLFLACAVIVCLAAAAFGSMLSGDTKPPKRKPDLVVEIRQRHKAK